MSNYKCYFDGACEPKNPGGNMGMGIHIIGQGNEFSTSQYIPAAVDNTNNVAEYLAYIKILKLLKNKTNCNIEIFGDSKLVIMQMSGEWKIKKGQYVDKAKEAWTLTKELEKNNSITFTWIPREQNGIADELSKKHLL